MTSLWAEAVKQVEREMPHASLEAKEERALQILDQLAASESEPEETNPGAPNYTLACGHTIFWHGEAEEPKQAPPATLWCRQCHRRVRTS